MTESEWLVCADPIPMLNELRKNANERKLRLFFCACCRGVHYTICLQGLEAVGVAEAYADGLVTETVRAATQRQIQALIPEESDWSAYSLIAWALQVGKSYPLDYVMMWAILNVIRVGLVTDGEVTSKLRDIFGPRPFRKIEIESSLLAWNCRTVLNLAQTIYEKNAFDLLPILADALEEAGCEQEDLLHHCRDKTDHVRGCWVIDHLLNKN